MKPPARVRAVPRRYGVEREAAALDSEAECDEWSEKERRLLLRLLRKQSAAREIDLLPIELAMPNHSPQEVAAYVERLKERSTRSAIQKVYSQQLQEQRRRQQQLRAPLQIWTELAEAVTGTLDKVISNTVCQTLMIAATESLCQEHVVPLMSRCGEELTEVGATDLTDGVLPSQPPVDDATQEKQSESKMAEPDDLSQHVEFTKIYRFLSAAVRGATLPQLAPLECAVLLELLLSLPTQLEGLSRQDLGAHLHQAHSHLHKTIRCRNPPQGHQPTPGPPTANPDLPHPAECWPGPFTQAWALNPFGIPLQLLVQAQGLGSAPDIPQSIPLTHPQIPEQNPDLQLGDLTVTSDPASTSWWKI
ncbi:snRNA-activating protein complex subunit 2 [Hypanus sabinus]|uniref:snRNA-activating protein complex subunit 2 n=1 Tax=Hypanus sabinus TaxID=79690 RepID=UPI0028C38CAD|nr:snRNA-activating protein complex subunit 2 [Hypanus sabinus]